MNNFAGWKSEMSQRQQNIEKAVIRLADGMNGIREDVNEMKTNHLLHLQKSQDELKKTHIIPIYQKLEGLANKDSKLELKLQARPSWFVTSMITGLTSSCVGLAMWIITHG